jgi:hypothetical protein
MGVRRSETRSETCATMQAEDLFALVAQVSDLNAAYLGLIRWRNPSSRGVI